jgi:carbamoylphosphate synthase large subunit
VADHGLEGGLKIVVSHSNPQFVARAMADEFFEEEAVAELDYPDWCLDKCREIGATVFWPSKGAGALAERKADFEARGVRLMVCASGANLGVLNDKAAFYRRLEDSGLNIPRHRAAYGYSELKEALDSFSADGALACLKPCRSLYGLGFKIVSPKADPLKAFLQSDALHVTPKEALERLNVSDELFPPLLVMELLSKPEYSVDGLARSGRLVCASIRRKPLAGGQPEVLIEDGPIMEVAAKLTEIFGLSHIFNLQLMGSPPKILEINPRMAGGLYFSCLAGINYPYWALKLALSPDAAEDPPIPKQRYNLMVSQYYQPFVYAPGA